MQGRALKSASRSAKPGSKSSLFTGGLVLAVFLLAGITGYLLWGGGDASTQAQYEAKLWGPKIVPCKPGYTCISDPQNEQAYCCKVCTSKGFQCGDWNVNGYNETGGASNPHSCSSTGWYCVNTNNPCSCGPKITTATVRTSVTGVVR